MNTRLLTFLATLSTAIWSISASAQLFDDNEVFRSYLTSPENAPVIDGILSLNEWDVAGPPIVVNNETRPGAINGSLPGDDYGGDADLSYQFRSVWVAPWDLYFLVEITDDVAMDATHNLADQAWNRDQIELFIDGDQLTGGNIRWWDGGEDPPLAEQYSAIETYGKFGVARTNEFEGNNAIMNVDPEEVGANGVSGSGIATETGDNANYFVEYRISMLEAYNNGLFDGTDAGNFGTMIPDLTAIKFQVSISDNDNFGLVDDTPPGTGEVRSHGSVPFVAPVTEGPNEWWRSDVYPNLLMSSEYVPNVGGDECDFDGNGACDIDDLDALTLEVAAAPAQPNLDFDLDGDGVVGTADQDRWRELAGEVNGLSGPYLRGDVNLDGSVDAGDLNIIGINWNSTKSRWSEGNVVGDEVGAEDLNALGITWQQSTPLAASHAAVPEPQGHTLALLTMLVLTLARKRSSTYSLA